VRLTQTKEQVIAIVPLPQNIQIGIRRRKTGDILIETAIPCSGVLLRCRIFRGEDQVGQKQGAVFSFLPGMP